MVAPLNCCTTARKVTMRKGCQTSGCLNRLLPLLLRTMSVAASAPSLI